MALCKDGVIPGHYAYEAGQNGVGDIFAWYLDHAVPPAYHEALETLVSRCTPILSKPPQARSPGESGLLALDWWLGNRSTLVDTDLTGLIAWPERRHHAC